MSQLERRGWHRELNRYHWFVLVVAALGWLFDTMDQQLFTLARAPAMNELLAPTPGQTPDKGDVTYYGTIATSIFLIGWATGGLFFGMLGDRIGRAKTMMLTILVYSFCTGLSAISQGFWDFAFYRFLTGLGVGGEFAVGVALVAEVMPDKARPFALGLLQALSAVGNVSAALIGIFFGHLEQSGVLGHFQVAGITVTAWRVMFLVGAFPALLAVVIRRRLKEPEQWQAVAQSGVAAKQLGSYRELFSDARWRKRAIVGLLLALSGVIGLWGIGFFSPDLIRSVFGKTFAQQARDAGQHEWDRDVLRLVVRDGDALNTWAKDLKPDSLIDADAELRDAQPLTTAMLALHASGQTASAASAMALLDTDDPTPDKRWKKQTTEQRSHRQEYLSGEPRDRDGAKLSQQISARAGDIRGRLTRWAGYTLLMQNLGAFFGIYGFSLLTHRVGRRPAFAVSFIAAGLCTAFVFWNMKDFSDVFWMVPLMGFCQLSLFGGYAIYFPELFPTRLRSTGISFCYNVGRFIAALGPPVLGYLSRNVFGQYPEPMRYAGVAMCSVFLIGLLTLPFAPETKGQPLPE